MPSWQSAELSARITAARAVLGDYRAAVAAAPLSSPPGREWMLRLAGTLGTLLDAVDLADAAAPRHLAAAAGPPSWKLWRPGDTARPLAEGTEETVTAAARLIAGPVIIESPGGLEWERS